jgi:carboxyl-terminal processing protease
MRPIAPIFFIAALSLCAQSLASPATLKKASIRTSMEEMLAYHVEFKEFSPLIVKRSFKLFIEQFDPDRCYFLNDEVKPFFELAEKNVDKVIKGYKAGDFSQYEALNEIIVSAIERAREIREEIGRELTLHFDESRPAAGESYSQYASSPEQLKERLRKKIYRFLSSEKKEGRKREWSAERRSKIIAFLEKKLRRFETTYLPGEKGEHFLAMHVLKSMAKSLDAHTAFFTPEEALEMRTSLEKQFEGLGVVLKEDVEGVLITGLVKGGPAERCGKILPGDLLVEIDGSDLLNDHYEEVLEKIKGDGRKEILLGVSRIEREGEKRYLVPLQREKIVMDEERLNASEEPFGDGIIAKLVLHSFYESEEGSSCEKDMRDALRKLKAKGKILGVVLDLRENSGGFLSQAVKAAGLFITSGVIVISKYAKGELQYLRDLDGRVYYTGPLIVLTSKASASAAEIVAQALQDYGSALVAGDERTYGKGSIQYQNVTDRNATAFYKVTVGKYYTVSGRTTQIEGVKADILVPTPYSIYNIGERYLEYPLKNDRLPSAYVEPLSEADKKKEFWWQRKSLSQMQKKFSFLAAIIPTLRENSAFRLDHNKNFKLFLKSLKPDSPLQRGENFGLQDLQMAEAVNILKDMIVLEQANSEKQE